MVLGAHAVDDGFDARVQELDDQHQQAGPDQKRALDRSPAEPHAGWHEDDTEQDLLAKRGFVAPRGAQAREREERGVHDSAQPLLPGLPMR